MPCPTGSYFTAGSTREEDSCVLCPTGTFSTAIAATSSATCKSLCESSGSGPGAGAGDTGCAVSSCPPAVDAEGRPVVWTVYNDASGSEGNNSCLAVVRVTTPRRLDTMAAACSAVTRAAHLATFRQMVRAPDADRSSISFMISSVASLSTVLLGGLASTAAAGGSAAGSSWRWTDGTVAANLNCGTRACGLWCTSPAQPE